MSQPGAAARAYMSIGELLGQLRGEFSDITVSKIRFLEAEGLVEPDRTASGYRKFSRDDLARLRYVLAAQRDHYLPLRVIKEHLAALDRGLEPPDTALAAPRAPRALFSADGAPTGEDFAADASHVQLSRDELLAESGLDADQLRQVEQYGLLAKSHTGYYDGDALVVAVTVAAMAEYGLEARHLRAFRTGADREVGLFEQVVAPVAHQRGPDARARADETVRELAALSVRLHATLVKIGLRGSRNRG